ncbi:choice-of-anchor I family protein [Geminocystis herdmanii]|uniref:choice-of-anchor I family protein n=1 Tax=Geminocystis herdmanii TaxID=669359 RepID=UPI00034A9DA0|nr:choice-of-anchor I family protein [Geminocystis herdmanii]
MTISLNLIGRFASENGSEIPAFDSLSQRLFIVAGDVIEILDFSNTSNITKIGDLPLDTQAVGEGFALLPNSVAVGKQGTVSEGIIAVALAIVETATGNQQRGEVQFFDSTTGEFLDKQTVGFLPDMVDFTPDGTKVLSANEGEPNEDYTFDPEGSISIIDLSNGLANATVQEATFTAFNDQVDELRASGVRIFGPNATVAQDVEPEYIAFSGDGSKAWVTLQENNAVAVVDIATATVESIVPLGFKDHSLEGNGIDPSDRDDVINIRNVPVFGMYMPDSIASYTVNGQTYYVTANEGDARVRPTGDGILDGFDEGDIYNEEIRLGNDDYILDPVAFPNATELKENINLGRLTVTNTLGDTDGDGDFDEIYAFGARSFSIWDSEGNLVFDSGDDLERITAQAFPDYFNASNSNNNFDDRSDNKGPEPEGVTVGKINGQTYAFVGLERIGGVMVYNLTNPETPEFVQYINTRDFEEDPETNLTDSGAEGLIFISAQDSPNGKPLLVVSNETSNTTTVFEIEVPQTNFTLQLLHASDQEAGIPALEDAIGFSAVMNALDARYENTLKLTSGDLFIAGPFFNASQDIYGQQGIADILVQNALGWDAAAVGNHEFDAGTSAFYNAIAPDFFIDGVGIDPETGYLGALFPYLSSNLDYSTDSSNLKNLVVESGQAPLPNSLTESVVIDVNGEQVGVIGAVVPYLPQIANIGGITMLTDPTSRDIEVNAQNLADNIQPFVDELVSQGINKIILMTHLQQFEMEQALATKLSNVDIIMGGGSHRVMANDDDILRDDETQTPPELLQPYPQVFQDADGNDVYLINTGANYRYLGQLIIEFDPEGQIIEIGDESGTFATDIEGVDRLYEEDITTFDQVKEVANPDVVAVVDNVGDFINSKDGNIFGNTEVWLNGFRSDVRTEETNLGNLTADANLWYAQQYGLEVDISVKNGGGIRDQIGVSFIDGGTNELVQLPPQANPAVGKEEGDISQLDIENSLRFDNKLSVADISAQGIKDLAEHFVAQWAQGVTPGQFGQIGGFSFSFDPDNTPIEFTRDEDGDATGVEVAGERIQNLVLNREDGTTEAIVLDGELVVNSDQTYKMVILDFLAGGGDSYPAFYFENVVRLDELTADNLPNNSNLPIGGEQDALAEYLAEFHPTAEEAFNQPDTPISEDTRIQNLNFREDSLLDNPVTINIGNNGGTFDFGSRTNGLVIVGGDGDDNITTGSGFDRIILGGGDNIVNAGAGDDVIVSSGLDGFDNQIDGGEGFDTVIYDGVFADFPISVENGVVTVGSNTDTLINIEQLQFNDRTVLVEDLIIDPTDPLLNDQIYRFRTGNGTYLYVGDEEKQRVLQGNFGFVEEGEAFKVSFEAHDELIPIYRFRNSNLAGAYLYVGEAERQSLLTGNNFGFVQEGLAFYTYGADTQKGEDIYRFSTVPGGYIFVGEAERQSIQQNYSSFNQEGIAFEVLA